MLNKKNLRFDMRLSFEDKDLQQTKIEIILNREKILLKLTIGFQNPDNHEEVEITFLPRQDLITSNPFLLNIKKLIFLSWGLFIVYRLLLYMVDWGFLFERFKSFCYSRLKTARSSISGSKILKGNVNRVRDLHFFFKRFNLPKVVYIPCFFFYLTRWACSG
jgi:hypothetical protein